MAAAATAESAAHAAAPKKKGKMKLVLIAVIVALLLAAAGVGALIVMKRKAAERAMEGDENTPSETSQVAALPKPDLKHPPTFLPLDPFVVNLSDRDAERYAQIGVTLEVEDAHAADLLKLYMPAIRNGILMVMAHKSSQELLERSGKELLATEILREAARPLGFDVPLPSAAASGAAAGHAPAEEKGHDDGEHNPVRHVHFSNFIIQ